MKRSPPRNYTCADYRDEMRLLALKRRLESGNLPPDEREAIRREVERIEKSLKMG